MRSKSTSRGLSHGGGAIQFRYPCIREQLGESVAEDSLTATNLDDVESVG